MNNLNPLYNYITEGQVKKRLINKIMNRSRDHVLNSYVSDDEDKELPKRWTSTTKRALGTKRGRAKILNSGAAKKVQRQAIESGRVTPEQIDSTNKKFINRSPIQ